MSPTTPTAEEIETATKVLDWLSVIKCGQAVAQQAVDVRKELLFIAKVAKEVL